MFTKLLIVSVLSFAIYALECPKGFLCGNGCGLHESEADASARAQIAKMFSTRVISQFTTIRSTLGELDESYVREAIEENIVGELEGVTIQERKVEGEEICAQAALNMTLFSVRIKNKTQRLYKRSKALKATGARLVWEKIRENNQQVNHLNSLLLAVDMPSSNGVITIDKKFKPKKIDITFEVDDSLKNLTKLIDTRLQGNSVYNAKGARQSLKVKLQLNKKTLNVSGFEKYELVYELVSKQSEENLGKAFGKIAKHGRSKEKIVEQIFKEFVKRVPEIFVDIKI